MRAMAVGMAVFFIAIARATFIESSHGIQAAKFWVYNARWFELLMVYLAFNLIANIVRHKMWKREKIALLSFHISFIVILIGAGITRFFGYEGIMPIREGATVDYIYSADPYFYFKIDDGKLQLTDERKLFLSNISWNDFSMEMKFPNHKTPIKIEYVDFLSKHIDSLVINDSIRGAALEIVTDGKKSNYVPENDVLVLGNTQIAYGSQKVNGVNVFKKNGTLMMRSTMDMSYLPMEMMRKVRETGSEVPDSAIIKVAANEEIPLATTTLYTLGGEQFVFKGEIQHAKKVKLPSGKKDVGSDYLIVKVSDGKESKIVTLEGGMGMLPTSEFFLLGGLRYQLDYGSKKIQLPFSIQCNDFIIERYPGSEVASTYASDLEIKDPANNYNKKQRVFMNHVIDYQGYRFFQSGFDPDEKGTRLSVNFDFWGTNITYIGYLLMAIGMILSCFAPTGRFRSLIDKLSKGAENKTKISSILIVLFSLTIGSTYAQSEADHNHADHANHQHQTAPKEPIFQMMSKEHSEELASLLVEDFEGRIVPMHTVCDQLLRKLYRAKTYNGKNAVQTVISMHMYPDHWMREKIIQVPAAVRTAYNLDSYASFQELTNQATGQFKWLKDYELTMSKREVNRSETEKKLIKLVEKYQVFVNVMQWGYMKLMPVKNDPSNTWYVPMSPDLMAKDSISSRMVLVYLTEIDEAAKTNNYREAIKLLGDIKAFQRQVAPESILPSEQHVKVEISYNNMEINKNTMYSYLLIGFILFVLYFMRIFAEPTVKFEKRFKFIRRLFVGLLILVFIYHGVGLTMRGYVSGHVPWSNGYEADVFIAFVTMIAGFIFSRSNPVILAGAALLAFFMLFVTEMSLFDPEITPLQPVLKSYWLKIHVAIITGSYGFLGLAAMLGFVGQILFILRNSRNSIKLNSNINEITYVTEMIMIIGLFMLTIGTFLGGVWANESWGRYWGWDPKETWALVSVLVYAIILHFRFIPGLKGKFLFNAASFWGYSAIMFTFFGVNFFLVGLHSYAQGDGLISVPSWIIYTVVVFMVFTAIAAIRNRVYNKQQRLNL